jgi:hypothetical protein
MGCDSQDDWFFLSASIQIIRGLGNEARGNKRTCNASSAVYYDVVIRYSIVRFDVAQRGTPSVYELLQVSQRSEDVGFGLDFRGDEEEGGGAAAQQRGRSRNSGTAHVKIIRFFEIFCN